MKAKRGKDRMQRGRTCVTTVTMGRQNIKGEIQRQMAKGETTARSRLSRAYNTKASTVEDTSTRRQQHQAQRERCSELQHQRIYAKCYLRGDLATYCGELLASLLC